MYKLLTRINTLKRCKGRLLYLIIVSNLIMISPVLAHGQALRQLITVEFKNTAIKDAFKELNSLAGVKFVYSPKDLDENKKVSGKFVEKSAASVIDFLLSGQNVTYSVKDNTIIIRKVTQSKQQPIQQRSITGQVLDESGKPLGNVTVKTNTGSHEAVTDDSGNFNIAVVANDTQLHFSLLGYSQSQISLTGQTTYIVHMNGAQQDLEEVVVVGYGTQKKVNLTGSVSAIGGEELSKRLVGQTSMALQGALPGVTITQRSGQPGADAGGIRIRGIGTLNNANPLVLIDGVEGSMENIDPLTIESISVLKDAASSSIYGSRAANGVILITTKRMSGKGFTINYSGYGGVQSPTDLRDMVNAQDHMSLMNIAYENTGASPVFDQDRVRDYANLHAADPDNSPDVDWQDLVYTESGFTQNHTATINAGMDRIKLMGSFGYYSQKGLIKNTDFDRYSLRLNTDIDLTEKLSLRTDVMLRQMTRDEPGSSVASVIQWLNRLPATEPALYTTGLYGHGWQGNNPLAMTMASGFIEQVTPSVQLNLGANYKITDKINVDVAYAPHIYEEHYRRLQSALPTYYPDGSVAYSIPEQTMLIHKNTRFHKGNVRATIHYDDRFNDHGIQLLGGWHQEDYSERWFQGSRRGFDLPGYEVLDAGSREEQQATGAGSDWALRSFFGRANYDFKERYLFEANLRVDGSSRFAPGHKWGIFPSFSAGWRISEEPFWEPVRDKLPEFKFRVSWGQLGNQNIGTYPFDAFVDLDVPYIFNANPYNGAALLAMANNQITWETTEMTNFGVDFRFLNNFQMTFDYYVKNTRDILLTLDVPKIIGLAAPYQNAGKVRNKGWELALSYANQVNDFSYNFGFNLSDVKNKIIDLKGINNTGLTVNHEGYAMNSILALEAMGFFTSQEQLDNHAQQYGNYALGDIMYKDQLTVDTDGDGIPNEADGIINDDDKVIVGNTIPRFTFGFTTNLSWKNFDFHMMLQGVGKADGYLYSQSVMPFYLGGTAQEAHKDYWREDNQNATFPRLAFNEPNNENHSTFWMRNAAYLRVKNIQVGYTLPQSVLNKIGVHKLRIFASGQNLFSFDSFWDGFDVEAPVGTGNYYPQVRNFSVGLDLNF